jgi:hypothetical protein
MSVDTKITCICGFEIPLHKKFLSHQFDSIEVKIVTKNFAEYLFYNLLHIFMY